MFIFDQFYETSHEDSQTNMSNFDEKYLLF